VAKAIATIGYEGADIDDFINALKRASIKRIIDVRDLPLSRKKGFSKNQLAECLAENGIEYIHLKGLGDPKEGRLAARAGQYKLFEKLFGKHIKTPVAQGDLKIAAGLVQSKSSCLLCYEADHEFCHRRIVAEHLQDMTGLNIKPLVVTESGAKMPSDVRQPHFAYA
jgi:uncharacterized protein (DUF488 family)